MLDYEAARTLHLGVGDEMTLKFIRRVRRSTARSCPSSPASRRVAGTGIAGAIDQLPFHDEPRSRSASSASSPTR